MAINTPYSVTNWADGTSVINAQNLNKIETRVKELENAGSLLAGTVNSARLPFAKEHANGTIDPANIGIVALSSSINSTLTNNWAATPKAVNELRLNSAEPIAKGDRRAKLAVKAEALTSDVALTFIGGVSGSVSFSSGGSKSVSITVDGTKHTHTRKEITAEATESTSGFVKIVKSISESTNYALNQVPEMNLIKDMSIEYKTSFDSINKTLSDLNVITNNITSLNLAASTPLKKLQSDVGTLKAWKPGVDTSIQAHGNSIQSIDTALRSAQTSIGVLNTSVGNIINLTSGLDPASKLAVMQKDVALLNSWKATVAPDVNKIPNIQQRVIAAELKILDLTMGQQKHTMDIKVLEMEHQLLEERVSSNEVAAETIRQFDEAIARINIAIMNLSDFIRYPGDVYEEIIE